VIYKSSEGRENIMTEFATSPDFRFIGDVDVDLAFTAFREWLQAKRW